MRVFWELLTYMISDPRTVTRAVHLMILADAWNGLRITLQILRKM